MRWRTRSPSAAAGPNHCWRRRRAIVAPPGARPGRDPGRPSVPRCWRPARRAATAPPRRETSRRRNSTTPDCYRSGRSNRAADARCPQPPAQGPNRKMRPVRGRDQFAPDRRWYRGARLTAITGDAAFAPVRQDTSPIPREFGHLGRRSQIEPAQPVGGRHFARIGGASAEAAKPVRMLPDDR